MFILALCLRVSFLATIIGVGLILPLNLTARCFKDECSSEQIGAYNLTDYESTTIANIPTLFDSFEDVNESSSWWWNLIGNSLPKFSKDYDAYLGRLYAVVGFSWILVGYTLHLMKKEWVDALALRRVYYLEGMHWENRVSELNQTVLNHEIVLSDDDDDEDNLGAFSRRRRVNAKLSRKKKKKKRKRDPWIPHPEQRETVPNIELYSVLVGNIPSLPSEVTKEGGFESMGFSKKQTLDWQLAVTVRNSFFLLIFCATMYAHFQFEILNTIANT